MITLKTYQTEAIDGLVKDTYSLLKKPGAQHKMIFKAPTGSGKTVTMAAFLNRLSEELPEKFDLPKRQIAYIWIAPNQLHYQSYLALKSYFAELRSLKPIHFEDITDGRLKPNEILFLNWQSVNKDGNLYIKENESDKSLISYINQARNYDTEIIAILDEAHLFATKGKSSQDLLNKIFAKVEIDVSATPLFKSDYSTTIKRPDVVAAEMIKQGVILNPDLDSHQQQGKTLNRILMELALKKRKELAEAYKNAGIDINPLLLIQLPNDKQTESVLDIEIKEEVLTWLKVKVVTTENHKLAIWLSNTKSNLDGIEKADNMVDVLLFKQAIALGWDCPRAAVLLIFREIQQETFTIQTVGRILRMPEQKHYSDSSLNYGYVFTNLSKDMIKIVQDDMDYIVQNKSNRIESYKSITLQSAFINTRLIRNRLGSKFRKCFFEAAQDYLNVTFENETTQGETIYHYNYKQLKSKLIELDVEKIEIPIPKDVLIETEIGETQVKNQERFAKTPSELDILFRQFCRDHVGGYAKIDSTPVLELAIKLFFEEYLSINEYQAVKIMLYEQNKSQFVEVIDRALQKHEDLLEEKASLASKRSEESIWEVPAQRIYNDYYQEKNAPLHALIPFYENKSASNPEINFTIFLENNKQHIEWWYKNGDKNKEDFAVNYINRHNQLSGFYVDFVIKLKNGKICLFDTKTVDSDPEFCNKHNALIEYIEKENANGKNLVGGVIVPKEAGVWKYCDNRINSAINITGWVTFIPGLVN